MVLRGQDKNDPVLPLDTFRHAVLDRPHYSIWMQPIARSARELIAPGAVDVGTVSPSWTDADHAPAPLMGSDVDV
jgi:hypothetical protein